MRALKSTYNIILSEIKQLAKVDIFRISDDDPSPIRRAMAIVLRPPTLAIRLFKEYGLATQASALTYSTLLSIVPILALLFSIAKGFDQRSIVESQLMDYFPGQKDVLIKALTFVDSYIEQSKSELFVGAGILLLLWTVLGLISNIEQSFNEIWSVKNGRSYYRRFTDFFSLIFLLPIFMVASSGLSIYVTTMLSNSNYTHILGPVTRVIFQILPFLFTSFAFTFMFVLIPNTRVKVKYAILPGILCGISFQLFQFFYISGQIWVSKYNAIYGSFAALPLLLLWLQVSWTICLLGALLTHTSQNSRNYNFEKETSSISNRYRDFVTLIITTLIVKRFENQEPPLSGEEISYRCKIPTRLTQKILYHLSEAGILSEMYNDTTRMRTYQPAIDIHLISVGFLFDKLYRYGSEDFKIDKEFEFAPVWNTLYDSREFLNEKSSNKLLLDIEIELPQNSDND
ncbi:MAG: YihY/virulence factor BrkB family protein [Bacteroidales bacterium]